MKKNKAKSRDNDPIERAEEVVEEGYLELGADDIAVDDDELVLENGESADDASSDIGGEVADDAPIEEDGDVNSDDECVTDTEVNDDSDITADACDDEDADEPDETTQPDVAVTKLQWIQSGLFVQVMILAGIMLLLFPKQAVSADEKRKLAAAPVFSTTAFFSGTYSDQAEAFYNDNFIFRNAWLDIADKFKTYRGYHDDEIQVVRRPSAPAGTGRADPNVPEDPEFQKVKALIITKGRAVQSFGGTKDTAAPFAELMNDYRATLPSTVKVYSMVIPSGSDYYLPSQVTGGVLKERVNIDQFNAMLDPSIVRVPAYDAIAPHTGEYIWFKTDHHWTGLGAYYAYRAFVLKAGMQPVPLKSMEHKQIEGSFLGSLYYQTKDKSLTENRDVVHYYKIPNDYKAFMVDKNGNEIPTLLYFEMARGGSSYGVFLGGDHPLTRVKTKITNGRKVLMIKDSYGNALAPYLAANFSEVTIVDYRYFKGSIPQLIEKYGITDFLYAQNSFAVNSQGTVKFGRQMLGDAKRNDAADR